MVINMFLTNEEQQMCDGEFGETIRKSMDILVALGDIYGASGLVDITSAQVSGVSYKTIGEAGLEYLQDLAKDESAKASVNASLNPPGTDLENWKELGFPEYFAIKQNEIVDAYADLGILKTCTCTPYLVGNVPRFRDHISWSESSAVAYSNSVIGARTNREGGPAALAAAIVGKTPLYGFHLAENRKANLVVNVETELNGADFGALGYIIGKVVGGGIPYFKMQNTPDNNDLKTLGAALASSGSVALYHVENVTPEYDLNREEDIDDIMFVSDKDILETRQDLTTTDKEIDLVCLGCPHASLEEIKKVASVVQGKTIRNKLWICTSVSVKATADRMGYTQIIEEAGGNVVCDTCMVVAPIEDMGFEVIGVNSAKAANYVPSMCGLDVVYDDVENLVKFQ
jgi:predicted aconitase